jgi:tricorn protease
VTAGIVPRRLTYHPGTDPVVGWDAGWQIHPLLDIGPTASGTSRQLHTVPLTGGFPTKLPLPISGPASFSPDGLCLAYLPHEQWQAAWKRYRGGQTTPIWIATLGDSGITKVPRDNSNDKNPLWVGDTVYFLSDRNGPVSLFAFDTKTIPCHLPPSHGSASIRACPLTTSSS